MVNYAKGFFVPTHPEKYVGTKKIIYRSSWELAFCQMCDKNPHILKWASESISIPYKNPLTNRQTIYVPDFFIQYETKHGKIKSELIEVKPITQTILEHAGNNKYNKMEYIKNQAKWAAAKVFCKKNNIDFRVISKEDMFHTGK